MKRLAVMMLVCLLMLSVVFVAPFAIAEGAQIQTDKADYAPDETVTISGSGFSGNAEVTITITAPGSSVATIYAQTDGSGAFTAQYKLNGIIGTYTVTATDGTNTASTTFTESSLSYSPSTVSLTIAAGASDSFTLTLSDTVPQGQAPLTYSRKSLIAKTGWTHMDDSWVTTDPNSFTKPAGFFTQAITVTVTVPSGATPGGYAAILKYTPREGSGCEIYLTVAPPPQADVAIQKTGVNYAHEGGNITYQFTVTNYGPGTAYNVQVVDNLLGNLTAKLPDTTLNAGEVNTFSVNYVVPTPSGDITNTVTVTSTTSDPNTSNNQASWTVDVLHPGIDVTKTGPTYAHEGDLITYTITVSNTGDCPLSSVLVSDSLLGTIYSNGLAFGEIKTFFVDYQIPIPSGDISNTVTAVGYDALGMQVSDSASWFVKVQYLITVTASPATTPPIGGTFKVTYTKCGITYTDEQHTTTWTEWVDSGTTVTVSCPQDPVNDYWFRGWWIDSTFVYSKTATAIIDAPKRFAAKYCELRDPLGDVNLDGYVTIKDIMLIAERYGAKKGGANYDAMCDVNKDGEINFIDLVIAARHFGI